MIRCRICNKLIEISNEEAEIITQYGEKTAERKGMIKCDLVKCDECKDRGVKILLLKGYRDWEPSNAWVKLAVDDICKKNNIVAEDEYWGVYQSL